METKYGLRHTQSPKHGIIYKQYFQKNTVEQLAWDNVNFITFIKVSNYQNKTVSRVFHFLQLCLPMQIFHWKLRDGL